MPLKTAPVAVALLLACMATPVTANAQDTAPPIPVQLLFDGQPFEGTAKPAFSCYDEIRGAWTGCRVSPNAGGDGYVLSGLAPGRYTLHVEIDENTDNPNRFPGDYDVFQTVEIARDTPFLRVNMLQVMHLVAPWDNDASVDGMLTRPWSEKPALETARASRVRTAVVTFKWNAVAPGTEYRYEVHTASDAPYERGAEVRRGTTRDTTVVLRLPVSAIGSYLQFGLTAYKNGRQVGELFTHDAGAQGWTADFVIRDWSPQPKAAASKASAVAAEAADATNAANATNAAFVAEWQQAVRLPAWWESVAPASRPIGSYGDLLALWQSNTNGDSNRRRFYKSSYQAILDHPGDRHLVAAAIDLMANVADPDDRLPILVFGVDHFMLYNQRIDDCANCKVGDAIGEMVRDLAAAYISAGQPEAAIAIVQRLVAERAQDISAYNLALTYETMSRAYWQLKDADGAKAAIEEGLRRFPVGWQADQLRKTLERYESASADLRKPADP